MAVRQHPPAAAGSEGGSPAFAAFRGALGGVFEVAATAEEASTFAGAARWLASRSFALVTLEASAARLLPARTGPPDAAFVAYLSQGEVELSVGATRRRLPSQSALLLDGGEPFELRCLGPTRLTMLATSRAALGERLVAETLWHGLALEGGAASAAVVGSALDGFSHWAGRAPPAEAEALAAGLVELVAKAANFRLRDLGASSAAEPMATLRQIRRFVDRNLGSTKLDTAMIARAFGLSRASLYRLFAPIGGVATYLRQARLARARRVIASPQMADRRIADIAHEAGFRSATVFNRLFLAEFGATPTEARAAALSEAGEARLWTANGDGELAVRLRALS